MSFSIPGYGEERPSIPCANCGRNAETILSDGPFVPYRTALGYACSAACVEKLRQREEDEHVTMTDVADLSRRLGHRVTGEDVAEYHKGLRRGEVVIPLRREPCR